MNYDNFYKKFEQISQELAACPSNTKTNSNQNQGHLSTQQQWSGRQKREQQDFDAWRNFEVCRTHGSWEKNFTVLISVIIAVHSLIWHLLSIILTFSCWIWSSASSTFEKSVINTKDQPSPKQIKWSVQRGQKKQLSDFNKHCRARPCEWPRPYNPDFSLSMSHLFGICHKEVWIPT